MSDEILTTDQIAKACKVSIRSVQVWIEQGKIKAFKTPGGHRRITKKDLLDFLVKFNMPIPEEYQEKYRSVLVVDDEKDFTENIKTSLEASGSYKVTAVNHGMDALIEIGKNPPDVAVIDVVMPEIDGIEVCRRILANPGSDGIKLVVVTGQTEPEVKKQAEDVGVHLFMNKPITVSALKEKIETLF